MTLPVIFTLKTTPPPYSDFTANSHGITHNCKPVLSERDIKGHHFRASFFNGRNCNAQTFKHSFLLRILDALRQRHL